MEEWLSRTSLLLGESSLSRLRQAHVLVVGIGGVGAYAAEMLVRAGIGGITLLDADRVEPTNLNRQLVALHSTLGRPKVEVLGERLRDIHPGLRLHTESYFLTAEAVAERLETPYDFVVDAIDTIAPKTALLEACFHRKIRIISSMGAGARLDPSAVAYADIADTCYCGLAREVRRRLREKGIRRGVEVVFSREQPRRSALQMQEGESGPSKVVGTVSYLPALFGCYLAAYVIRKLAEE
ncbi:MAG: tRNA threonylcarbamoyladenosine dehydratase [Porphyromonadaceae bacterium]|nr:tRNA threonylcarbamoyladenosine dehydratase [Porphyromonadaceae bacterium]